MSPPVRRVRHRERPALDFVNDQNADAVISENDANTDGQFLIAQADQRSALRK